MRAQRELADVVVGQASAEAAAARAETAVALQRLQALEQRMEAFRTLDARSLAELDALRAEVARLAAARAKEHRAFAHDLAAAQAAGEQFVAAQAALGQEASLLRKQVRPSSYPLLAAKGCFSGCG